MYVQTVNQRKVTPTQANVFFYTAQLNTLRKQLWEHLHFQVRTRYCITNNITQLTTQ